MNYDVAIITGWSNIGGSTECYVNLTNALNENGLNTILVGPHKWHLDRCNGKLLADVNGDTATNVIWHFMRITSDIPLLKNSNSILSCHETIYNPIFKSYAPQIANGLFDHFHFVSDRQREWQIAQVGIKSNKSMHVIPNLLDPKLSKERRSPSKKVGGVIGSLDRHKQTHISIEKALDDGCEIVRVFGNNSDPDYVRDYVSPLLNDPRVLFHGSIDDKNKMYASVSDVYHYSSNETWGYIQAECEYLNIPFHTNLANNINPISNDNILDMWKDILI